MYFGLMGALVADIRQRADVHVDLVVVASASAALGFNPWSEVRRSALLIWLQTSQWTRCFGALADGVAYRSSSWSHPFSDTAALWRSFRTWREWRAKQHSENLRWADEEIDGLVCGDLIVDSYLRFRPEPKFDVNDPFVWRLIWQAMRDIRRARGYFRTCKPKIYLTTYTTYIEHGIAVRVAIQEDVAVYGFSNLSHFGNRLDRTHWHQTIDTRGYRQTFESLDHAQQQDCLRRAGELLDYRLSGGIDAATAYMRQSAYATSSGRQLTELTGAVVIFLHDFYDSPNVYPGFVFNDFWDWITSTIETLDAAAIPFVLKPHPNQIALSDAASEELREKYPAVRWLDRSTNNAELATAPISCGVTAYGTVANELAYLGVPTICAAAHPHQSFGFSRTARSRQEHADLLVDHATRPLSAPEMKVQAMQFYSIQNNLHDPVQAALGRAYTEYYVAAVDGTINDTPDATLRALSALRGQVGYKAFLDALNINDGQ